MTNLKQGLTLLAVFVWEHYLTSKFQSSTINLLARFAKLILFKRKGRAMSFSKSIQAGPVNFSVSEGNSEADLKIELNQSLGGGAAANIMTAKASIELELSDKQAADLALALLEAKIPALKGLIDSTVKPAVDGFLSA
jgi:hypothetical protein